MTKLLNGIRTIRLAPCFRLVALVAACAPLGSAQSVNLIQGQTLDGWEVIGDGSWTVMKDGTLVGQRNPKKAKGQSWLYTNKEYGEFDLHLEYWNRYTGNSSVSIRDVSRAKEWDIPTGSRPSKVGYEIQINIDDTHNPTGSLYNVAPAKNPKENRFDWNSLDIESRNDVIRVKLNGELVTESPGDPKRGKTGPIGLQLHDESALVMFRNIRAREVAKK
jgi:cytochrome c